MNAFRWALLSLAAFLTISFGVSLIRNYSHQAPTLPAPAIDIAGAAVEQSAVFAGGCFWCTEAVFEPLNGVLSVTSGYAGGSPESAKYSLVSGGGTNHAESIRIRFDGRVITYGQLLQVFFSVAHDPTQLNRQGPDHGYQYRSEIFAENDEQRRVAEAYIKQLEKTKLFPAPIVTKVSRLDKFYQAEDYHQDYVKHHPLDPYVVVNANPKLAKLREKWSALLARSKESC